MCEKSRDLTLVLLWVCSVTAKSPIRTWSNARGEGKLFSVDLLDKDVSNAKRSDVTKCCGVCVF